MKAKVKRIGLLIVGWVFVALGIIGLFLPSSKESYSS
jgi:uncharacterized membrane protein YbaN (DUF454 family)